MGPDRSNGPAREYPVFGRPELRRAREGPMMRKEIDIVVEAARKQCAVVEKASHLLWAYEELLEASASGLYQGQDRLLPPTAVPA
jgi:hypothetical protein